MRQSETTQCRVTDWVDLVERTLRGALDVDHVAVLTTAVANGTPGPGTPLVLSHVDPSGRAVDLALHRVGRDFTAREKRLAASIVEALERASRDDRRVVPPPLPQRDVADALERCLHDLDDMVAAPLVDRLAMVANRFASRLDAAGWWLGRRTGTWAMTTAASGLRRSDGVSGEGQAWWRRVGGVPEITWSSPVTSAALEGGSVVAWRGEDSEIAKILDSWGDLVTLVAAGGYDLDARQWMLCLIGDEVSPDLRQAQAALSAAVQVALGFPRAPRHR